jgi:hypothetical protein
MFMAVVKLCEYNIERYLSCVVYLIQPALVVSQAVSRRFSTSAARVGSQIRPCGISGGQNGTGSGFL